MSRLEFQKSRARGTILNIGCGDDPANFGAAATHLDIDWWNHPNFVHGNCHALPFPDGSFDTAILGDVLEHCADPTQAIREAARVARRLVVTVPEETRLPSVGQHIKEGLRMRAEEYRKVHGYAATLTDEQVVVAHKSTEPRFVRAFPEDQEPHDGHINRFDEAAVLALVAASGKHIVEYHKAPEVWWFNWLIVLE